MKRTLTRAMMVKLICKLDILKMFRNHHSHQTSTTCNVIQHQMHCSTSYRVWLQTKCSSYDAEISPNMSKVDDNGNGDDLKSVFESNDEVKQQPPPSKC